MNIKKTLLSTILAVCVLSASSSAYDVGLSYGLNSIDGLDFKDHSFQATISSKDYAILDSTIVPRVDFEYVSVDDNTFSQVDNLYRLSLNGIYDLSVLDILKPYTTTIKPYVLGGIGYELVDEEQPANGFTDTAFIQFGLGATYAINDSLSLKLESKGFTTNEGDEAQLYFGVIKSFGNSIITKQNTELDTKIALVDSVDEVSSNPIIVQPIQEVVSIDSDSDGIVDTDDDCINTPSNYTDKVNGNGCVGKAALKVHFGPNSYKIKSEFRDDVNEFAGYLQAFPKYNAKIVGYVSTDSPSPVGIKLTKDRANMVKKALVNAGIDSTRLSVSSGYKAVATNKTAAGKSANRRVEVTVFTK